MKNDGNYSSSIRFLTFYSFHGEQQKAVFKPMAYLIVGRYKKGWIRREHICSRTYFVRVPGQFVALVCKEMEAIPGM